MTATLSLGQLVVSPKLLAELDRVLLRSKFRKHLSEEEARAYVDLFHRLATHTQDPQKNQDSRPIRAMTTWFP
jgi:predicted nucleic acid-binding protein